MPRRLHDHELLELIERPLAGGEAPSAESATLDPEVAATIEAMREDRAVLRAWAMPPLPRDFVAELAGALEPPAPVVLGAGRRARLLGWGGAGRRLAYAAGLGLAAAAALWITLGDGLRGGAMPTGRTERGDRADAIGEGEALGPLHGGTRRDDGVLVDNQPRDGGARPPLDDRSLAEHDLHHPLPPAGDGSAVAGDRVRVAAAATAGTAAPTVALIVTAGDLDSALAALRGAVEGVAPGRGALVRNVSLAEAVAFDARWRRALPRSGASTLPPLVAARDGDSARGAVRAPEPSLPRSTDGRRLASADSGGPAGAELELPALGEHLAGDRRFATAPELQFDLAERGFAHSITVPPGEIRKLLVALAVDGRVRVQLGPADSIAAALEESAQPPDRSASHSPIESWRRWQDAAAALAALESAAATEGRVTLPVRIELLRGDAGRSPR